MSWKRFLFPFVKHGPSPRDRYAPYHDRVLATTLDVVCLYALFNQPFSWLRDHVYGAALPQVPESYGDTVSWTELYTLLVESGYAALVAMEVSIEIAILGGVLTLAQYYLKTTPGRWLVGLKLVDAKTETSPTLPQLIRRLLGYFVSLPPFMLGYIWCAWDGKRQTWHDKIAGTVVVDTRPPGWYWAQVKRIYRKLFGKDSE
jgi:uncharacterized RDD family membrane protein YckC